MSDLFDKRPTSGKKINTDKKTDKNAKKAEMTEKQKKAQRKHRIITISVLSVFLLAFIGSAIINSTFIRRELPVVTIGNTGFSAAEFDYFYITSYLEYRRMIEQEMPDFAQFLLPSRSISLADQDNPSTGESWEAFFMERAIATMTSIVQRYDLAMEAGFTLPDEAREEIDFGVEMMQMQAMYSGFPSFESFLRQQYGPAMTLDLYISINEMVSLAYAYERSIIPEFNFTPDELSEYYSENKDILDVYIFRYFRVSPDVDPEAEDVEAATQDAHEAAVQKAENIASLIQTEDDFISQAMEYDPAIYVDPEDTLTSLQGEFLPASMLEWLSDSSRINGDVTSLTDESDYIYVIFFVERNDNSYYLTSFRQLLFLRQDPNYPITVEDFTDEEAYRAEFDRLDNEALKLAEELREVFISYGANEAALDQIISENEDLNLDGSEYSNIAKLSVEATGPNGVSTMMVVSEIEDWLFTPGRQIGDFELIRSEAYGYHLVYFMGFGQRLSDVIAENRLYDRESRSVHEAWLETLPALDVSKSNLFNLLIGISSFS